MKPFRTSDKDGAGRDSIHLLLKNALLLVLAVGAGFGLWSGNAWAQFNPVICPGGFGTVVDPPSPLVSLQTAMNPVLPKDPITGQAKLRSDLVTYIRDQAAATRLGKALYWDMQVGSDNQTACATCHFNGGGDTRPRNQIHPGANGVFNGFSPNASLSGTNFPFTSPAGDTDDIAGSQGVRSTQFQGVDPQTGVEQTTPLADPVFRVGTTNVRQVTGKNSPSVINAVFNHRQFWDGRAQSTFNGVSPFGERDVQARVYTLSYTGSNPVPINIAVPLASLASQAVGPVLNPVEMSAAGRTFPEVGRKLLKAKPLGLQRVDPTDGVLGPWAESTGNGLTTSYASLIQQAFQPAWWNSATPIDIGGKSYSMMEANFSLFWGLAVMVYEATLVADDSPMDQYLALAGTARPPATDPRTAVLDPVVARLNAEGVGITRENILDGLLRFELPAPNPIDFGVAGFDCIACHSGGETTGAAVDNVTGRRLEDRLFLTNGFNLRMERMFMQAPPVPRDTTVITFDPRTYTVFANSTNPIRVAVYDNGWYNIGVRATEEDLGLGGMDPFGHFLAYVKYYQSGRYPEAIKVPGNTLGCGLQAIFNASGTPLLSGPLRRFEDTAVRGSFKTPGLRNVELTGPYFHNGGKSTLMQVVDLYDNGGDFPGNLDLSPAMVPLRMTPARMTNLVAFLVSLTDERVRWNRAPFDHPQLFVPNGQNPDGSEQMEEIPAVGAAGASTPTPRFLNLNPFEF